MFHLQMCLQIQLQNPKTKRVKERNSRFFFFCQRALFIKKKLQDDIWWPFSAVFGDLLSFFVPHNFFKRLTLHGNSRISKFCVLYANIVKSFKNNLDVNWSGFSTRKKIGTKRPAAAKVPLFLNKLNNWVFCQRVDFVPKTVRSR